MPWPLVLPFARLPRAVGAYPLSLGTWESAGGPEASDTGHPLLAPEEVTSLGYAQEGNRGARVPRC